MRHRATAASSRMAVRVYYATSGLFYVFTQGVPGLDLRIFFLLFNNPNVADSAEVGRIVLEIPRENLPA